ncbi:hypothetical protein WICMUC_002706 [Wickerhamomyces mucosus]|uniref:Nucleoporin n=1 Tax=Wickerhamomyces mucosus TaxID=1378264 RepID=A0A9P8PPT5_9ASCO|nr:hypothetical protein WICMUC_002706 [Wickerhamomyces mucosus]
MERSRRQRLSEIYGEPLTQQGTPLSLRQRLVKQQLEQQRQDSHRKNHHEEIKNQFTTTRPPLAQTQLIPVEILDIGSQRAFVSILFLIIQAYKLYDLVLLKSNLPVSTLLGIPSQNFNFISKYFIYESAFFYFLPALRIPSLTFRRPIVLLQITLMLTLNIFLASNLSFPITAIFLTTWKKINAKDLTILGSTSAPQRYDSSKHFKGSHTIKILPENTAYLNPFQESFCLPVGVSNYHIDVPIRFNSSSEIDFLQIKHLDIDTNKPTLLNYTQKDIKKFNKNNFNQLYEKDAVSGPNIHYLNVPITKTGVYQINQVLDSKYLGLRNYYSTLVVSHCPTAGIENTESLQANRCVGELDVMKFTIDGVPPLKLKYKKFINREVQEFDDQSLQPEFFTSPLLTQGSSKQFSREQLKDLSWAKSRKVEVELENTISDAGDYSYKIESIVDGLGNLVNFTNTLNDNDGLLRKYDLLHSFYAYDLPKLHLSEKFHADTATKKALYLQFDHYSENTAPFETEIKYVSEDEQEIKVFKHTFDDIHSEYRVEKPGTYTLLSVSSKYCSSIISGRSSVSISLPVVPQLTINSQPITDSCVGQVGLTFDLALIGTPPFNLEQQVYRISNGQKHLIETKKLKSQGTRYRFSYEPSSEGNYEIVFTTLKDSIYLTPIELSPSQDFTYRTSMRVKPSADIINQHKSNSLCLGSQGKIPIQFKGESPFTLEYDIIETLTNKRTSYKIKGIEEHRTELLTPEFTTGGEYLISLTAVEDNSGCVVSLNGADATIKVRREIPSVEFGVINGATKSKIKEGSKVDLPIRFLGEGSYFVEYDYFDEYNNYISTHQKNFKNSQKASIEVSKAGYYKLKSVRDSQCAGIVNDVNRFEVSYSAKPSLTLSEHSKVTKVNNNVFEKSRVCQYHEDSIDLVLHGSAPFIIDYAVVYPNGERKLESISVATRFASIRLLNGNGGEYKYYINGIYDALYSKKDLEKIHHKITPITLRQKVTSSPQAEFIDMRKPYRTCTTRLSGRDSLEPIKLKLDGNSPYTVTFEIFHESSSKSEFVTLSNVNSNSNLEELYKGLKLGNHVVSISKIVDKYGCFHESFNENNYISISITDTPKINQLDPSVNYCVGDHVGYQLIGTPPFTVGYSFNGLPLKAIEHSTQFVRLASDDGVISIDSLKDSSSNCVVNFTATENKEQSEKLSIQIHPIPSVEVSQGDSIIQDIHEGDQAEIIFTFEGTPPFTLTYVRTEEVGIKRGKKKSQVVETHTVNDIYAYEFRVLTSLQGTYEAIEVSDAYCVARNE